MPGTTKTASEGWICTPVAPKIGYWWAPCCISDLQPIKTDEDAEYAKEFIAETGIGRVWPTLEEALRDVVETDDDRKLAIEYGFGDRMPAKSRPSPEGLSPDTLS